MGKLTPELRMVWVVVLTLVFLLVGGKWVFPQELAPLELFQHPPQGTLDPYSPFLCACHGRDCNPVPTNWDTGMIQLVPDGPWVDLYRLQTDRIYDANELPGEYSKHVSICRNASKTKFTCIFSRGAGV